MKDTAYAQALKTNTPVPSYIEAADAINIANNNKSFLESFQDGAEFVPKFVAASLVSGANQLYNVPADIGNLFGGNFERSETADVMESLSSDLGQFYQENQSGVDLAGFLVSSFVPGSAAVKVLNAGQVGMRAAVTTGRATGIYGKAFGLLAPPKKDLLARAVAEASTGKSASGILSQTSLKSIGAGLHQGALEALAFETAVTATLFNSPILENQDLGDFITNVAFGAGAFGLISGSIDAVKLNSAIKGVVDDAALQARPYTFIEETAEATARTSDKIVLDYNQIATTPAVIPTSSADELTKLTQARDNKLQRLDNRIRSEYANLAGGDQDVATALYNGFKSVDVQDVQAAIIGLEEVSRFGVTAPKANRAEHLYKKLAEGKASVREIDEFAESNISVKYAQMWGEDVGKVFDTPPAITNLVDTLGKKEVIKVKATGSINTVTAGKHKFDFPNPIRPPEGAKPWNIKKSTALEANARYMLVHSLPDLNPTAKKILSVDVNDIPMMEKVLKDLGPDNLEHVKFTGLAEGESVGTNLHDFLSRKKLSIANDLLAPVTDATGKVTIHTQDEIAAIVNIRSNVLNGQVLKSSVSEYSPADMYALQTHAEEYTKRLVAQGTHKATDGVVDITKVPKTVKLTYDSTGFKDLNNHVVENMAIIKEQQRLYQDGTNRAVSSVLGNEAYERLQDINTGTVFKGALPSGSGAGLVTAANANYGTLAATVQDIGRVTSDLINTFRTKTKDTLEPLLYKLGQNEPAAIEWSTLNQRVRSIEGDYGLSATGDYLEPLEIIRWKKEVAAAQAAGKRAPKQPPLRNPDMDLRIDIKHKEVRDLLKSHIEVNGARTNGMATIRTSQGVEFNRAPDAFYPMPVDPKDFPFFGIVTDSSITSGNQSKTLYARTAAELDDQIAKLRENPQLTIRTGPDAEEYYRSIGQFDYEKAISANYLDTEVKRKGISAPFLVSTDPEKIVNDVLKWHMDRESGLVRETVAAKYEVQFEELMRLGDEFTNTQRSKFGRGTSFRDLEDITKNPFADYIKTALGIRKTANYPWWSNPNQWVDQGFSKLYNKISDLWTDIKHPHDLIKINKELQKAGYKGAHYDEQMEIFANATPDRGVLTDVVQKSNAIMATVALRWDVLNAVNNAISANVLLGSEVASIQRAIARGDSKAAGALAELTRVKVPGTDKTIMSPQKLIANSIRKFGTDTPEMQFYRDNGFITSISKQYQDTLDTITFNPSVDSVKSWGDRVDSIPEKFKKAGDFGELITGNKLAEEFNRFVAADVMKQMSDVAVDAGLMSKKEQLAYINTFVNRTQGNYLASQRPNMFAGPVGQAIGLFQTYQFNLMQQMLRYVGEGTGKDTMTLLALQGTIHGMNGLPAFNAVNTHLIGTASGNKEHKDVYSATYGTFGKEAGDWLMYGAASNMFGLLHPDLKVNLYTRGDINPRHVTIVPTDPASIPFIQATGKVMANLFDVAGKLGGGADVTTTLLQGLEHNGLSRPLAGLAQTLQAIDNPQQASYSTSKRGNVIGANDFLSLTNLARIAGGKPMDEAIAIDATYRYKAYSAKDSAKRDVLGESIKSTLIAGKNPTSEQVDKFAEEYAKIGGTQQEFGKWFMGLYKTANQSQVNEIQKNLKSPFSQSMQQLMGGQLVRDFSDTIDPL